MTLTVRFVGSGDAFGSGGRLQTCLLVDVPGCRFAIDFGATALAGLRRQGIDPNTVDAILLTHLHGDHCAGIPFLLLDAMLGAKRAAPLTILGPRGSESHIKRLGEVLFPGSDGMIPSFPVEYVEVRPGEATRFAGGSIAAVDARHTRETHPLAVRVTTGGKSLAYTGDGELTAALAEFVSGVDLLVAESYFYSRPVKWHLNYPDIARLSAKRIILTHMHSDMLEHAAEVPEQCAYDGLVVVA